MGDTIRSMLGDGIFLNTIHTTKFKSGTLSINLFRPLREEEAAMNALLPSVLRRGSAAHPDLVSLAAELDELYGASVCSAVRKRGEIQIIGLGADFNDDRYIPDCSDLLERVCALVGEVLLRPVVENGVFKEEYFESEKKNLIDSINSRVNDKISYTQSRLIENMCAGEAYGIDKIGSKAAAEAITNEALYRHYVNILATSQIEIVYVGSADHQRVKDALTAWIGDIPRGEIEPTGTVITYAVGEPRYIEESLDVTQGKLAIGFRTGVTAADEDYAEMVLFNAVFGGGINSKLFMNVREKLSLCYYASSGFEKFKGLLLVNSGVEFDKYETARAEIFAQLEACKNGDITEQELESSRMYLLDSLACSRDSLALMEESCISGLAGDYDRTPEELMNELKKLAKEDVVRAAKRVQLDTVFFLKGAE